LFPERLIAAAGWLVAASPLAAGAVTAEPTFTAQVDAVSLDGEAAQTATEFRRLRPGLRGRIGPSLTWAAEIDVAEGNLRFTNLQLALAPTESPLTLVVGQVFPPTSLETASTQMSSSFLERAQLHDVFSSGRRLGAVAAWQRGDVLLSAGAFGNDVRGSFPPGSRIFALRGVWAPEAGAGRLHIGGNVKWRDSGSTGTLRYAARQGSALLDTLLLDTGRLPASGDSIAGLELAGVFGRLSFATEVQRAWLHNSQAGGPQPGGPHVVGLSQVTAGYAEIAWYLTPGDRKAYSIGRFGRTRAQNPLGKGGVGAWQASLRSDWADAGSRQRIVSASLHWTATDNVRLIAQLSRIRFEAAGSADASQATLLGLRTHFIY